MEECKLSGVCCRLFYINLSKEEYESKTFKTQFEEFGYVDDFKDAEDFGANILSKNEDGSCVYLVDNKCSIHKRRPNACRDFFCTSPEPRFAEMVSMVHEAKTKMAIGNDKKE